MYQKLMRLHGLLQEWFNFLEYDTPFMHPSAWKLHLTPENYFYFSYCFIMQHSILTDKRSNNFQVLCLGGPVLEAHASKIRIGRYGFLTVIMVRILLNDNAISE
jgi:hypothetical protein